MIGLSRRNGIAPGVGLAAFVLTSCGTKLDREPNTLWLNEVMPVNLVAVPYVTDTGEEIQQIDWLELYNASDADVDLSEYSVSHTSDPMGKRYLFGSGPNIQAGQVVRVWASDHVAQPEEDLDEHYLEYRLGERDALYLFSPAGQLLDGVSWQKRTPDSALARFPDGEQGQWVWCATASPGAKNGDSCATPVYGERRNGLRGVRYGKLA